MASKFKKVFIMPYFGNLPEWFDKYEVPNGYDFLLDTDINAFRERVRQKLGIDYTGVWGSPKPWDFRCALGLLYEDEIKKYDWWFHTDLDVVFGDVDKWITDDFLEDLAIHSNHHSYINGCWSGYRNTPEINNLFRAYPNWKEKMSGNEPNGWIEQEYSRLVENSGFNYKYTFHQGWPYTTTPNLFKKDGKLYQDGEEIMMFHFRRSKKWPL
jgi:hypothetical protein